MLATLSMPNAILESPGRITVIVGRNGSGKSIFLRDLTSSLRQLPQYKVSYISPERGGAFVNEPNIEQTMISNPNWIVDVRNQNQVTDFKKTSAQHLRGLETTWGRLLDQDRVLRASEKSFATEYTDKINKLFLNIKLALRPGRQGFMFQDHAGTEIQPGSISSGESEIVALGSEILSFFSIIEEDKTNVLAIDEPDVHLHPDMQVRLANFIIDQIESLNAAKKDKVCVIIATHSTSLAVALSSYPGTKTGTKHFGNSTVTAKSPNARFQRTAKFFAHPLSQVISEEPLFIIEGADDTRVLQQAARSAQGKIKLFPCEADSVDQQTELERYCNDVLSAIYDHPIAYSLRDGDGNRGNLEPVGCVVRFRLQCYAIENLLLTDEFLRHMESNWGDFQAKARTYSETMPDDDRKALLLRAANSADRGRDIKIKDIRTLICVILGSDKPWEFLLGQAIGSIPNPLSLPPTDYSFLTFLGIPLLEAMGFLKPPVVNAPVIPVPNAGQ